MVEEKDQKPMDTLKSFEKFAIIEVEEHLFWRHYQILEKKK